MEDVRNFSQIEGREGSGPTNKSWHAFSFPVLFLLFVCFLNFPLALVQIGPINRTRLSSRSLTRSANALGVGERRFGRAIDRAALYYSFVRFTKNSCLNYPILAK